MNRTEKQPEEIIDHLATSTRSPRGQYSATASREILDRRITARSRRRMLRIASSVAAAVLVCALFWNVHIYQAPARIITVSTLAESRIVQLPDGSEVTLNRNTTLSYPEKFKQRNREIQLQGGAWFAVSKDKEHPFIVQTEAVDIQVLGTEFSVEAYPEDELVKTILFKGSVAVTGKEHRRDSLILTPGEKAVYSKTSGDLIKEEATEKNDMAAWKDGAFVFSEQPLKEVTRQLINAFGVQIKITGKELEEKRLSGRFTRDEKLDNIMDILQEIGICTVTKESDKLYILSATY